MAPLRKKIVIIPLATLLSIVVLAEAVFLLVPTWRVRAAIEKMVQERAGLIMRIGSLERVFPLGYEARGVVVAGRETGLNVEIESIRAGLSPISLLRLSPSLLLSGEVYGGVLRGSLRPGLSGTGLEMEISGASPPLPGELAWFETGPLEINMEMRIQRGHKCAEGLVRARGRQGRISARSLLGILGIPGGRVSDEGFEVRLKDCKTYVRSAWFESPSFHISARGVIGMRGVRRSPMTLYVELNPKGGFARDLGAMTRLRPYKKGEDHYLFVIRGSPGAPVLSPH